MLRSCSLVVLALACSPALSADLPLRGAIVEGPPIVFSSWDGAYVGAHASFSSTKPRYTEDYGQYNTNPAINGLRAGVLGGYNFQFGDVVMGVEGDVSLGRLKEGPDFNAAFNNYTQITQSWQANARLRLGYVIGPAMLFVAGGAAWGSFTADDIDPGYGKAEKTSVGWTLGAGAEYAITPSWLLRGEYMFSSFSRTAYLITGPKDCTTFVARMSPQVNTFRLALMYRFGAETSAPQAVLSARY